MKNLKYLLIGIVFGLALTKGEAISWFRMQEMFHFQGFHMYGIFMTAVPIGAISILLIRKLNINSFNGEAIDIPKKHYHHGIYAQVGAGYAVTIITFISAMAGTWVYAKFQPHLP